MALSWKLEFLDLIISLNFLESAFNHSKSKILVKSVGKWIPVVSQEKISYSDVYIIVVFSTKDT